MLKPTNSQDDSTLKPTLILTTLIFLMFAPAPDSRDITEMTADFLVPTSHSVVLASDKPFQLNLLVAHPDSKGF